MSTETTTAQAAITYSAPIGPTQWRLTAVGRGAGVCDHCGRTLVNTYTVTNPAGEEMVLGRGHVKLVTGYNLSQAEAARILRHAAECGQRAARWAAFAAARPEVAATISADVNAWTRWYGARTGKTYAELPAEWDGVPTGNGPAAEVRAWIGEGMDWQADRYLARRRSGEFAHWLSH